MVVRKASLYDITKRLRELFELECSPNVDATHWYVRAREFKTFVDSDRFAIEYMTEEIWHYLSDLDIRLRDQEYANAQRGYIERFISGLEKLNSSDVAK